MADNNDPSDPTNPHGLSKKGMRDFVIKQVLKVNPNMKGTRSNEEFSTELMASVKANKQSMGFTNERFTRIFRDMLNEFEQEFDQDMAQLLAEHEELLQEKDQLKKESFDQIVEFLGEVQPGGLTEPAKTVLRNHYDFFKEIGGQFALLHRVLKQKDIEYLQGE